MLNKLREVQKRKYTLCNICSVAAEEQNQNKAIHGEDRVTAVSALSTRYYIHVSVCHGWLVDSFNKNKICVYSPVQNEINIKRSITRSVLAITQ